MVEIRQKPRLPRHLLLQKHLQLFYFLYHFEVICSLTIHMMPTYILNRNPTLQNRQPNQKSRYTSKHFIRLSRVRKSTVLSEGHTYIVFATSRSDAASSSDAASRSDLRLHFLVSASSDFVRSISPLSMSISFLTLSFVFPSSRVTKYNWLERNTSETCAGCPIFRIKNVCLCTCF